MKVGPPILALAALLAPVPSDMQEPFTFEIRELFKTRDGKTLHIEALVIPAPYGMPSGWDQ